MEETGKKTHPVELLTALKSYPFLAPYNLTLYCRDKGREPAGSGEFRPCGAIIHDALSNDMCTQFFGDKPRSDLGSKKTAVHRYCGGFLSFTISFEIGDTSFWLVGNGVRDKLIDFWQLESLSRADKVDVFSLLNQLEKLPVTTVHELEEVAEQIHKMLPSLQVERLYKSLFDQTVNQLSIIVGILEQVDNLKSMEEILSLSCEMLGLLFNFPKILIALQEEEPGTYSVAGTWGLPKNPTKGSSEAFTQLIKADLMRKTIRFNKEVRSIFPDVKAERITCFPLRAGAELPGILAIFDNELQTTELLLVELVANKIGAKLAQLKKEAEQQKITSLSNKLMSLTNTLLFAESKDELYKIILEVAADLLNATQGSIMLLDKNGENLHIVFTLGMSLHLAQCMTVKVGRGISGKVAKNGTPLLVNDVEKDNRVGMKNRPRFRSKSLICIPLKLKDKIIGVLNLSDKEDLSPFTETDMNLLTSYSNLASLMIERTLVMEESSLFEQLAVTDPLTGLYNRRFLKSRLEEELNRSIRQGLNLTILFIDLDYFKIYNDVSGHLAGDEVLRKTASIIKASVREMDVVARYGGEEFCAILPGTTKSEAIVVAERIRGGIEKEKFPAEENLPLGRLTTSLGIASFPEDGHTFTSLVHAADVALYEAKANGRNRIVAAYPSMAKDSKIILHRNKSTQ